MCIGHWYDIIPFVLFPVYCGTNAQYLFSVRFTDQSQILYIGRYNNIYV